VNGDFQLRAKQKMEIIKTLLVALVEKGCDIDLCFVDLDTSAREVVEHEVIDDGDEIKSLLRVVYLNGAPVFCFEDLERIQTQNEAILKMAARGDSNLAFVSHDQSPLRSLTQVRREDMVISMDQVVAGQWLMIYIDNKAGFLVQVTKVPPGGRIFFAREWGKNAGIKEPGWLAEGMFCTTSLGIRQYPDGSWEATSWAEFV
jgi:hypothetical protein